VPRCVARRVASRRYHARRATPSHAVAAVRSTAPAGAEARPGGTAKAACRGALLARPPRQRVCARARAAARGRVRARRARCGDDTLSGVSLAARGLRGDGANSRRDDDDDDDGGGGGGGGGSGETLRAATRDEAH